MTGRHNLTKPMLGSVVATYGNRSFDQASYELHGTRQGTQDVIDSWQPTAGSRSLRLINARYPAH